MKTLFVVLIFGLSGCFSANGGNAPSGGEPEIFSITTEDDIDKFLATLTPQQQMELMYYADEMNVWSMHGSIPPEPEPPEWLKPYLEKVPMASSRLKESQQAKSTAANYYTPPTTEEREPQNLIKVYSAPQGTNCPPCQRFKAWYSGLTSKQREDLSVEFIAVDPQSHPAWLTSYPTFHWKVGDQWWKSEGWEGIDKFAITYNQTLKLSKKKGGTTRLPEPLPENKSSASLSVQEPPLLDGPAGEPLFQSDTEFASSYRQKRRWK